MTYDDDFRDPMMGPSPLINCIVLLYCTYSIEPTKEGRALSLQILYTPPPKSFQLVLNF